MPSRRCSGSRSRAVRRCGARCRRPRGPMPIQVPRTARSGRAGRHRAAFGSVLPATWRRGLRGAGGAAAGPPAGRDDGVRPEASRTREEEEVVRVATARRLRESAAGTHASHACGDRPFHPVASPRSARTDRAGRSSHMAKSAARRGGHGRAGGSLSSEPGHECQRSSPGLLAGNPPPRWGAPGDDRAARVRRVGKRGPPGHGTAVLPLVLPDRQEHARTMSLATLTSPAAAQPDRADAPRGRPTCGPCPRTSRDRSALRRAGVGEPRRAHPAPARSWTTPTSTTAREHPALESVQAAVDVALRTYSSVHRGNGYASKSPSAWYEEARAEVARASSAPAPTTRSSSPATPPTR